MDVNGLINAAFVGSALGTAAGLVAGTLWAVVAATMLYPDDAGLRRERTLADAVIIHDGAYTTTLGYVHHSPAGKITIVVFRRSPD